MTDPMGNSGPLPAETGSRLIAIRRSVSGLGDSIKDSVDFTEEGACLIKRKHAFFVREGLFWIGVNFDKETIDTDSNSCPGECRNEVRFPVGDRFAGRTLDGVGRIKDHLVPLLAHRDQTSHVDDEISMSKGSSTFGDPGFFAPPASKFFHHG